MAINIALAGNPNCGKTTMFNDLTGANQYVGNWPGVTVEKKEGRYRADKGVVVTDLPGVYSLSPYTPEEIVTRDYLMSGKPDAVINLVDATNLERNLYLTTQIIDLGIPTVVALNMMDLVEKNGDKIDVDALAKRLGCPVVPTSALKGRGMEEVVKAAIEAGKKGAAPATTLRFTNEVEEALAQVIDVAGAAIKGRHARWYAIKLLEGEQLTIDALNLPAAALSKIAAIRERLEDAEDDDAESIITNERYDNITEVCDACVRKSPKTMTTTQKIDRVVTNRILGIPIFIVIMFLVYYISVSTVGTIVTDWPTTACSAMAGSTPAPNSTRPPSRSSRASSRPTRAWLPSKPASWRSRSGRLRLLPRGRAPSWWAAGLNPSAPLPGCSRSCWTASSPAWAPSSASSRS